MERQNPHLWHEPSHFLPYCDADEMADIIEGDLLHLDWEAANLLERVASHHRDDWADPKTAVRLRRMLKLVAAHLRDRR